MTLAERKVSAQKCTRCALPNQPQPVPPATPQEAQMRIESLSNPGFQGNRPDSLADLGEYWRSRDRSLRAWHDKAGNAVSLPLAGVTDPETGLTFPNLNNPPTELTQTNKILPEPCSFLSKSLPVCSVIRPTLTQLVGAVATVKAFRADGLFRGQSAGFF